MSTNRVLVFLNRNRFEQIKERRDRIAEVLQEIEAVAPGRIEFVLPSIERFMDSCCLDDVRISYFVETDADRGTTLDCEDFARWTVDALRDEAAAILELAATIETAFDFGKGVQP